MKKEDRITSDEIAALIERAEARALKEGDAEIITEVIRKTLMTEQLFKEGKLPFGRKLRRLLAIPRPKKTDEKKTDE